MMIEISHPTILKARVVMEVESHLLLWVEPYKGNLLGYLGYELGTPLKPQSTFTLIQKEVRQAKVIRKIVWQIIDGLEHLMINGYYHGNFTLLDTYYNQRGDDILVKLTNFRKKSGRKSMWQWRDLVALGTELKIMSSIADKRNRENNRIIFDITLLDDLAQKLKDLPEHNLGRSYAKIKTHVYFWETYHRKKFFVYFVSLKMKNKEFKSKVDECEDLCKKLPWDHDDYNGFLQKMKQFREKRKKRPYKGNKSNSGKKVDAVITRIHLNIGCDGDIEDCLAGLFLLNMQILKTSLYPVSMDGASHGRLPASLAFLPSCVQPLA
ncbi:hypothetical protein EJB05_33446 [Eragrostis curvula]|uniref:Protein kinase domain-containing protein n=1 Tax=Eragrostis curvula TaxID=38414 RepID=A0A5J9U2N0_9POAL|nr:hypothetical protein EJB05_33446 [Eragrostis curvula]